MFTSAFEGGYFKQFILAFASGYYALARYRDTAPFDASIIHNNEMWNFKICDNKLDEFASVCVAGVDVFVAAVVSLRDQEALRADGRRRPLRPRLPLLPQRAALDGGGARRAALHGRQSLQHSGNNFGTLRQRRSQKCQKYVRVP